MSEETTQRKKVSKKKKENIQQKKQKKMTLTHRAALMIASPSQAPDPDPTFGFEQ